MTSERTDFARCFEAIHLRHSHVHENSVECATGRMLHRFASIVSDRELHPDTLHHLAEDELIGSIVLGKQYLQGLG